MRSPQVSDNVIHQIKQVVVLALSCNFQILFLVLRSYQLLRVIYLLTYMGVFDLAFVY